MAFDSKDFLTNNRIKSDTILQGEHLGRKACFKDSDTIGVDVFDYTGKTLLHEKELKPVCYSTKHNQLISFDKNIVTVSKIVI